MKRENLKTAGVTKFVRSIIIKRGNEQELKEMIQEY